MEPEKKSHNHIRRVEALKHTITQVGQTLENIMHALADMRRESNANIETLERVIERENDLGERRNNLRERERERRRGGRIEYGA